MQKTLTMEPGDHEATEMQAAIARFFAEIDEVREEMRRDKAAIESSQARTDAVLAEVADVLADLKAA